MNKPIVFFAHANGVPSPVYHEFLHVLSTQFTVINPLALSIHPDFPITPNWSCLVDEVEHYILTHAQGQPVHYIGHSMGGILGYTLALKKPHLFKSLTLLDPPMVVGFGSFVLWLMAKLGYIDRVTPAGRSKNRREFFVSREEARGLRKKGLFRTLTQGAFDAYIEHAIVPIQESERTARNIDAQYQYRLLIPVAHEVAVFRSFPSVNYWKWTRVIRHVPVQYITGEDSDFYRRGTAFHSAKTIRAPFKVLQGGHMFPLEYPHEAASAVLDFLNDLEAR